MRPWPVTRLRQTGRSWPALIAAILALAAGLGVLAALPGGVLPPATSGKGEANVLAEGRAIYAQYCARCHGADLEGQSNWQTPLPSGRLPAPPHDASGHTWHHSDRVLFEITKRGPAAVVGGGYESDMPGFAGVLTDERIEAVLAFIKSRWPERERRFQERVSESDREAKQ
jgi:mono/diheme cytochrome c family protein